MRRWLPLIPIALGILVAAPAAAETLQVTRAQPFRGLPAVSGDGSSVLVPFAAPHRGCAARLVNQFDLRGTGRWRASFRLRPCGKRKPGSLRREVARLNQLLREGRYRTIQWQKRRGNRIELPGLTVTIVGYGTTLTFRVVFKGKPAPTIAFPVHPGTRAWVDGAAYVDGPEAHFLVRGHVRTYWKRKLGPPTEHWWALPLTRPPPPVALTSQAEAKKIYKQRCAPCHGPKGDGKGLAAPALNPRPRDYTDPTWQKTVTDAYLAKVIVGGGPAVGKAPTMPPGPDLKARPKVLQALVRMIRGFTNTTAP